MFNPKVFTYKPILITSTLVAFACELDAKTVSMTCEWSLDASIVHTFFLDDAASLTFDFSHSRREDFPWRKYTLDAPFFGEAGVHEMHSTWAEGRDWCGFGELRIEDNQAICELSRNYRVSRRVFDTGSDIQEGRVFPGTLRAIGQEEEKPRLRFIPDDDGQIEGRRTAYGETDYYLTILPVGECPEGLEDDDLDVPGCNLFENYKPGQYVPDLIEYYVGDEMRFPFSAPSYVLQGLGMETWPNRDIDVVETLTQRLDFEEKRWLWVGFSVIADGRNIEVPIRNNHNYYSECVQPY